MIFDINQGVAGNGQIAANGQRQSSVSVNRSARWRRELIIGRDVVEHEPRSPRTPRHDIGGTLNRYVAGDIPGSSSVAIDNAASSVADTGTEEVAGHVNAGRMQEERNVGTDK